MMVLDNAQETMVIKGDNGGVDDYSCNEPLASLWSTVVNGQ